MFTYGQKEEMVRGMPGWLVHAEMGQWHCIAHTDALTTGLQQEMPKGGKENERRAVEPPVVSTWLISKGRTVVVAVVALGDVIIVLAAQLCRNRQA